MEIAHDKNSGQLIVGLNHEESEAIIRGGSFSNMYERNIVEVRPLSEIDSASRAISTSDKPRIKRKLGSLISQVHVEPYRTIIHVPESFAQHKHHTLAEEINPNDMTGELRLRPKGGIRIQFLDD